MLQSLALLIHGINQQILFLFDFFKVYHIVLSCKGLLLRDCNIRFELQVVILNIEIVPNQILELLLGFGNFVSQHSSFLFFRIVHLVDLRKLLFRLNAQPLSNIKVIMSTLIVHLIGSQLLLSCVQSNSYFLLALLDLFPLGLGFLEL